MNLKIKFSHNYKKLNNEKGAHLFDVYPILLEDQTKGFIDYDTEGIYKLPERGAFLCLVFKGINGTIFTTLRRMTSKKYEYYLDNKMEWFTIITPQGCNNNPSGVRKIKPPCNVTPEGD